MTTSGTAAFNYNRDQIIRAALRKIGAIASGETPSAAMVRDCADALNAMVKEWDAIGIHLWTESEAILFVTPGQAQYSLGPTASAYATQTNPPNFIQTALATPLVFGTATAVLDDATNVLANDNIGFTMDDGTIFWTTVSGSPSGNTIQVADTFQDSAAAGNYVYDYTTQLIQRPLRIVSARRYNVLSQIDTPMIQVSRIDYRELPNKLSEGTPTQYFYDPQLGNGQFYIWPVPVSAQDAIKFTWYRQIQDFNTAADTPDLPQEWIAALIWGVACEMAPEFDLPPQRYALLKGQLQEKLDRLEGWDREPESIMFQVNFSQR